MPQNIAVRGDTGLFLASGPPFGTPKSLSNTKNCKVSQVTVINEKPISLDLFDFRAGYVFQS